MQEHAALNSRTIERECNSTPCQLRTTQVKVSLDIRTDQVNRPVALRPLDEDRSVDSDSVSQQPLPQRSSKDKQPFYISGE